ncbi:hypothetical protein ACK8P5_25680 (plasmid) [Paenibacillus sp. EC2-1]|uniref:hypothetical protein n=1 Tax=Paenibacillus sp. EC2-1 TaxID=3388665 RepID=UPI003BEF4B1A
MSVPQNYLIMTQDQMAKELARLQSSWTPGDTETAKRGEQLRMAAAMKGYNTLSIEQESYKIQGKAFGDEQRAGYNKTMQTINIAKDIAEQMKKFEQTKDQKYHQAAQNARMEAASKGLSLRDIEGYAQQYKDPAHAEPSQDKIDYAMKNYGQAAYYAGKIAENMRKYKLIESDSSLSDATKKAQLAALHQSSQNLRIAALNEGLDIWELEEMAYSYRHNGAKMPASHKKAAATYIDPLIQNFQNSSKVQQVGTTGEAAVRNKGRMSKNAYGATYSGADMVVYMGFPGTKPIYVGVATTLTYTTYREKKQIRTVGRISARGFSKGPRTISGKMIFTVMNEHFIEQIKRQIYYMRDIDHMMMDELPLFDILVMFGNEYGSASGMVISGCTIVDEQKTLSIEEFLIENIFTYLARKISPMKDFYASAEKEYNPSQWIGSILNAKGNEMIAKFDIDELILYEQAGDLSKDNPFTTSPEKWQYTWMDGIAQIEQGADPKTPPALVLVQVYDSTQKKYVTQGAVQLTINGGVVGAATGKEHSTSTFSGKLDSSLYKTQGSVVPGFVMDVDVNRNVSLKVEFTSSVYKAATGSVYISGNAAYVRITTSMNAGKEPPKDTEQEITAVAVWPNSSWKPNEHSYENWIDLNKIVVKPPSNLKINKGLIPSSKDVGDYAKLSGIKAQIGVYRGSNHSLKANWPVQVEWALYDSYVNKSNNLLNWHNYDLWDRLDQKVSMKSTTATPKLKKGSGVWDMKTDSTGILTIEPEKLFKTISKKGAEIDWSDMPSNIVLVFTVTTKTANGSMFPGACMFSFRKPN